MRGIEHCSRNSLTYSRIGNVTMAVARASSATSAASATAGPTKPTVSACPLTTFSSASHTASAVAKRTATSARARRKPPNVRQPRHRPQPEPPRRQPSHGLRASTCESLQSTPKALRRHRKSVCTSPDVRVTGHRIVGVIGSKQRVYDALRTARNLIGPLVDEFGVRHR